MTACWVNISNVIFFFFLQSIVIKHIDKPFLTDFLLCDFPLTAKSLVARLMEVDQDQRLTAQEAINHEW